MMMACGDVLVACPVCGRMGLRSESLGSFGPCDDSWGWTCDGCGASGVASGWRAESWVRVDVVPGFADMSFVVPPARMVGELLPRFPGRPIDDAAGLWDDGGRRPVLASSGVEVGSVWLEGGVVVVESWLGRRGFGLMMDGPGDVRRFVGGGAAGAVPAGAYVGPRRCL